jgi:hypothetical protein
MTRDSIARLAGLLYLAGLPTAGFAYGYVAFMPRGDPGVLLDMLESGRQMLRWTILIGVPGFSLLYLLEVLFFRELLKAGGKLAADLMVLLVAASVPLALAALAQRMDLIALLDAPGRAPMADVMKLLQSEHSLFQVATIFWGLWLLPLGVLCWRAGLVPRVIAALLIVAGCGYLWGFAGPLLGSAQTDVAALSLFDMALMGLTMVGELGFALWLMIFGAKGLKTQIARP